MGDYNLLSCSNAALLIGREKCGGRILEYPMDRIGRIRVIVVGAAA